MVEALLGGGLILGLLTVVRYLRAGAVLDRKQIEKADLETRALREQYITQLEERVSELEQSLGATRDHLLRCQRQVGDLGNSLASLAATIIASNTK